MIPDEDERLYQILLKNFTNSIMDNATAFMMMSLPQCHPTYQEKSNESATHRIEELEVFIMITMIINGISLIDK
jgi:hypothetical protein